MSRFNTTVKDNPANTVSYGLDHAFGWFYQEFGSDGECIIDLDSMTGLSKGSLIDLLVKTYAPENHLQRIALDLDPAEEIELNI